ncbi:MAG TPA: glycosyltransferase [Candidatus Udaeobacter sp.]|nr:glycosyltransferase [Candidatus Udaeobacter sp.]
MAKAAPRVTVIIPTYNWSSVLPYSIGSVLAQTFADFELLVVGDGCTDDSEQVVGAVCDPRLSWINLPTNSGHQSAPNNEGLRLARGELIAYLGHDDLWLPHHLQGLVAEIDRGADLAFAMAELVGPDSAFFDIAPPVEAYVPELWIPTSLLLHRRSVTDKVGGWRDYRKLTTDPEVDLCRRIHEAGFRIAFLPRLTAIKFPAAWRRDAYGRREAKEQKAWSERIEQEKDFEPREAARLIYAGKAGALTCPTPYLRLWANLLRETLRRIAFRIAAGRNSLAGPGARIDAVRRYKGLDPPR